MKSIQMYMSEDGQVFRSESECIAYEELDDNMRYVCLDNSMHETKDACSAVYAYLPDTKSVEIFKRERDNLECISDGIDEPGIYLFDDNQHKYVFLHDVADSLEKRVEDLRYASELMYFIRSKRVYNLVSSIRRDNDD